jgi:hypothetical protein
MCKFFRRKFLAVLDVKSLDVKLLVDQVDGRRAEMLRGVGAELSDSPASLMLDGWVKLRAATKRGGGAASLSPVTEWDLLRLASITAGSSGEVADRTALLALWPCAPFACTNVNGFGR